MPESSSYYTQGSTEVATESALTMRKLEKRRKLTRNSERLVIVLVGLPGRGKSFVARKLQTYLNWRGTDCRVFNVGRYRREASAQQSAEADGGGGGGGGNDDDEGGKRKEAGACDANFFDSKNEAAARLRQEVAALALKDMLRWIDADEHEGESSEIPEMAGGVDTPTGTGGGSSSDCRKTSYRRSRSTTFNSVQHSTERVAIFDATNSSVARRQWVLEECTSPAKRGNRPTGVVFVESICDDQELLDENFRFKIANSPDFKGMTPEEAITDLRNRVKKYEEQYETIADDSCSYIKIFNLSSKVMVNHIYGRMAKVMVPALMSWNIGSRPIYICRAGQTLNLPTSGSSSSVSSSESETPPAAKPGGDATTAAAAAADIGGKGGRVRKAPSNSSSGGPRNTMSRGGRLSDTGARFRDELSEFIYDEGMQFMQKRSKAIDLNTGTSVNGLQSGPALWETSLRNLTLEIPEENDDDDHDEDEGLPFPCHIMSSTMPRAVQTATWTNLPYPVEELSNLNPLDKGDFTGHELEDISEFAPEWYARLEQDPFRTRFPGGECYQDLINRLEPAIIDMEQQLGLVVAVSHVSVIQALMSYFRCTPVHKCAGIAVPIHTVIKFTPVRGGGWTESHHKLLDDEEEDSVVTQESPRVGGEGGEVLKKPSKSPIPIWGDHKPLSRTNSMNRETNKVIDEKKQEEMKDMKEALSVPDWSGS